MKKFFDKVLDWLGSELRALFVVCLALVPTAAIVIGIIWLMEQIV